MKLKDKLVDKVKSHPKYRDMTDEEIDEYV
jgi:hypothetical protein